jgi:hypothetical protein
MTYFELVSEICLEVLKKTKNNFGVRAKLLKKEGKQRGERRKEKL